MPDINSNESATWVAGDGIDLVFDEDEGEYTEVTVEATGGAGGVTDADYLVGTAHGSLSAEIVVGTSPGGELGGTWASPTVDATHAGSTHSAATDTHIADAADAHDASAISFVPAGTIAATDVQAAIEEVASEGGGGGAPTDVDYLVGTASGGLSAEIVVGTAPGGELGGTWASPTVDATHSGSTHSAATDTHIADGTAAHAAAAISIADAGNDFTATDVEGALDELQADNEAHVAAADPHTGYLKESDFDDVDFLVGTATGHTGAEIVVGTSPGGELGGTWASPTVDATHAGSTHGAAVTTHEAAGDPHTGYRLESADHTHQSTGAQAGTLDHGLALTGLTDDDHPQYRKETDLIHLVTFTKTGNLATGTGATRWYNDTGVTVTLASARGSVGTAPASQSILVDVNINGTSVWNATQANRITIAAAGNTDEGGAFDDATIADGEYLTVDIDQVGSGTVGADLTVSLWGTHS